MPILLPTYNAGSQVEQGGKGRPDWRADRPAERGRSAHAGPIRRGRPTDPVAAARCSEGRGGGSGEGGRNWMPEPRDTRSSPPGLALPGPVPKFARLTQRPT
ncbi:unnamed protein product [Gadus morhua 'NCC']